MLAFQARASFGHINKNSIYGWFPFAEIKDFVFFEGLISIF